MDVETQKQEALKREDERWQKANKSSLSGKGASKAGGSVTGGKSAKEGGAIEGNKNIFFQDERSVHSSVLKEGGEKDAKNEDEREKSEEDDKLIKRGQNAEGGEQDETKKNLMKQQEMIVLFDPVTKFCIRGAYYFLIIFLFIEIFMLPLSIMNIILLILMTIIVCKMLYNETRIDTYRSLYLVLQVLNIFIILYIFTKYMFLFTEYTHNIALKNSIENGYHQQGVNEDGTIQHSDPNEEQTKTEDARNQLHHSHDHDDENNSRTIATMVLHKLFGF